MARPSSNFNHQPRSTMPSGNMAHASTSFNPPPLTKPSTYFQNQPRSNLPTSAAQLPFETPTHLKQPTSASITQMNGHQYQEKPNFPQMNGPSRPQANPSIPITTNGQEYQPSGKNL